MNEPTREQKAKYVRTFFKIIFIIILLIMAFALLPKDSIVMAFYLLFLIFIIK